MIFTIHGLKLHPVCLKSNRVAHLAIKYYAAGNSSVMCAIYAERRHKMGT